MVLPAPEVKDIRVGIVAQEPNTYPCQWALDGGMYKQFGLTAKVTVFQNTQEGTSALLAGQLDALCDAPFGAFQTATTETPIVSVATFFNHFLDSIVTAKGVTSADSLRGRRIAISTLGGGSHQEVMMALQSLGLQASDVQITQVGGQSARIAALKAGSVAAAPVSGDVVPTLTAAGFNVLVDLSKITQEAPNVSLEVTKQFAQASPNTVLAMIAADMVAQKQLLANPASAVPTLAAWAQLPDADAKAGLEAYTAVAQPDLQWTADGFQNLKKFLVLGDPNLTSVDPATTYDTTFLDKLKSLGFQHSIGVPGY